MGAQEAVERLAEGLAHQVPEGDVDRRERRRDDPGPRGEFGRAKGALPDPLHEEGVLADDQRRQVLLEGRDEGRRRRGGVPGLADADVAGVGLDEDQYHDLFLPARPRVPHPPAHLAANDPRDDPGDLHGG
jgi:hypothetical protein